MKLHAKNTCMVNNRISRIIMAWSAFLYLGRNCDAIHTCSFFCRVATVSEKSLENEKNSRSGKSQGISLLVSEI